LLRNHMKQRRPTGVDWRSTSIRVGNVREASASYPL
jgi:hypothetical protein